MSIINFCNISFKRDKRDILDNVNIKIPEGKITAIVGLSGCGKTTVLKLITGELKPCSGSVTIHGVDITSLKRDDLFELRKNIGFLFQSGALFSGMNVFDNVAFPLRVHTNLNASLIRNIVLMNLEVVGLRGVSNLMDYQLSGGMKRRVALARAIVLDPKIVLYDEPLAGQDSISMGVLLHLMKTLNQCLGATSVIVSHDLEKIFNIADYIYILDNKEIMASGRPLDLLSSCDNKVRQFIDGSLEGPIKFHFQSKDYMMDLKECS